MAFGPSNRGDIGVLSRLCSTSPISVFVLWLAAGQAMADCSFDGMMYSDGASACIPKARGSAVLPVLHECESEQWASQNVVCPEDFAYFCKVGPYAIDVGEILLLGSGPQSIQCVFPGKLSLISPGATSEPVSFDVVSGALPASRMVQRVQEFLVEERAAGASSLPCDGGNCSGSVDDTTVDAVVAHVAANRENLLPEEFEALGISEGGDVSAVLTGMNPYDLFAVFIEIFDVP